MANNIINAVFSSSTITYTKPAYQYDYGMILKFSGIELPQAYEVHFSNTEFCGESISQIGDESGVTIPDEMFLSGAPIYAWTFLHTGGDDGETVYKTVISINKRAQPSDIEPTPVQQDVITQAIAALNTAVEQTAADVVAAGESAEAAAGSAEAAGQAKDDAVEAKDKAVEAKNAAETAQGKAEDAQRAAEQAAGSVLGLTADASVDANVGTPSVEVEVTTESDHKKMSFAFHNLKGVQGDPGVGISSVILNADYTLTITLTNGNSYTTSSIRGEVGATPNLTIGTVSTLPEGSQATATITGTDEEPVLNLGIPVGDTGDPGISPTITVTEITGGHEVEVVDAQGTQTFDVMDGEVSEAELTEKLADKADVIISSASGEIVTIADGGNDLPIKNIIIEIEPIQSGSGDPSSSNIRPLLGRTGCSIWRSGKNMIDDTILENSVLTLETNQDALYYGYYYGAMSNFCSQYPMAQGGLLGYKKDLGVVRLSADLGASASSSSAFVFRFYFLYDDGTTSYGSNVSVGPNTKVRRNRASIVGKNCVAVGIDTIAGATNTRGRIKSLALKQVTGASSDSQYSDANKIASIIAWSASDFYKFDGTDGMDDSIVTQLASDSFNVARVRGSYPSTKQLLSNYNLSIGHQYKVTADASVSSGSAMIAIRDYVNETKERSDRITSDGSLELTFTYRHPTDYLSFFAGYNQSVGNVTYSNIRFKEVTETADDAGMVYGGYIDANQNKLYVYPYYESYNGETLTGHWISDRDVYAEGTTPSVGAQVLNDGGTPIEYDLPPTTVLDTLLGDNTLWADCGGISEVEYRADTRLYIEQLTKPSEDDMTANANIASGKFFMIGNHLMLSTTAIAQGEQIVVGTNCSEVSLADALNTINS